MSASSWPSADCVMRPAGRRGRPRMLFSPRQPDVVEGKLGAMPTRSRHCNAVSRFRPRDGPFGPSKTPLQPPGLWEGEKPLVIAAESGNLHRASPLPVARIPRRGFGAWKRRGGRIDSHARPVAGRGADRPAVDARRCGAHRRLGRQRPGKSDRSTHLVLDGPTGPVGDDPHYSHRHVRAGGARRSSTPSASSPTGFDAPPRARHLRDEAEASADVTMGLAAVSEQVVVSAGFVPLTRSASGASLTVLDEAELRTGSSKARRMPCDRCPDSRCRAAAVVAP